VGDKLKEGAPIAVKIGKILKSSVNIIVTVGDAENHQNYTPKLKASIVTIQSFLEKSYNNLYTTLKSLSRKIFWRDDYTYHQFLVII
jgi:hypothetical protein